MSAPFGRRLCVVAENRVSGGYRIFSLVDREGPAPEPGQFYMLASERSWGEGGGRPYLPRAISVAETAPSKDGVRLDFLVEGVGMAGAMIASPATDGRGHFGGDGAVSHGAMAVKPAGAAGAGPALPHPGTCENAGA